MKLPWKKETQTDQTVQAESFSNTVDSFESDSPSLVKWFGYSLLIIFVIFYLIGFYWSREPAPFDLNDEKFVLTNNGERVIGYTTVLTTEKVAETLLEKPGGYLSNDVMPPSIFLDNIPSWEFGALVQVRDLVSALRNHMSRSQSQSIENKYLKEAEPLFNNDHSNWLWPAAEGKYQKGIDQLKAYRNALSQADNHEMQFYARADNLTSWLVLVEKRMGDLSQRLSASVGQERINTDLSGDSSASQSTQSTQTLVVKTPWLEIDNIFYEARGSCWALIHLLKAVEIDFASVLEKKNARASFSQIIRELEATQDPIWSPIILNGSGFSLMANHSLVMASYISRANAGVIDLRELLTNG